MDYKELLIKYMNIVGILEGTYYINYVDEFEGISFTKEEIKELKKIISDIGE